MNKRDLILHRDATENQEVKALLRWATHRIDELEGKVLQASILAKTIIQALKDSP
jgi:hypothetical protein